MFKSAAMSDVRMMEAAGAAEDNAGDGGVRAAYSSPSRGSRFSITTRRSNDRRLLIEDDGLGEAVSSGVAATSASASYGSMPDSGSDMARAHPGKAATASNLCCLYLLGSVTTTFSNSGSVPWPGWAEIFFLLESLCHGRISLSKFLFKIKLILLYCNFRFAKVYN